jgi:hypothetical protein
VETPLFANQKERAANPKKRNLSRVEYCSAASIQTLLDPAQEPPFIVSIFNSRE